jgi:hypothetical protein
VLQWGGKRLDAATVGRSHHTRRVAFLQWNVRQHTGALLSRSCRSQGISKYRNGRTISVTIYAVKGSVADPGIPDPNFFHPGSKFFYPGSRIRIKEFKYFNQKNCFQAFGNMNRVIHPGSRIQGSKRHQIPDPDVRNTG